LLRVKQDLLAAPKKTVAAGLAVLLGSLCVHCLASLFEIHFLSGFAVIGALGGLVLFNGGWDLLRLGSFPLFFLVFMVPLPEVMTLSLSFHMKLFAAQIAGMLAQLIIPLQVSGSLVYLPNGVLEVGAPCSGLKSLITLAALSLLFTHVSEFRWQRKIVFFLTTIPIALAANVLRIFLLIFVFYVYGQPAAMGWFHDFSGMLVFVFAFVGLVGLRKLFQIWPEKSIV